MTVASILLLAIGTASFVYTEKRNLHRLGGFLLAYITLLLLATYFASNSFTSNGIDDSIVFHARYGLDGAGFSEFSGIIALVLGTVLVSTIGLLWYFFRRWKNESRKFAIPSMYALLAGSLLLNPGVHDLYALRTVTGDVNEFYRYYEFSGIDSVADTHKNLVFIYAEGLERTYFDESLFPGLITHLREWESRGTSFTNVGTAYRTGWTIGGIVGSQLGIPLITASGANSMSGVDLFLPTASGLGDFLNSEGYFLSYLGGASLEFAGKGKFFKTHGFSEVKGRDDLLPLVPDAEYRTGWGLYDDSLFDLVFQRFEELSQTEQPFGLFTLTLDTHHPTGHPSKTCDGLLYQDGENEILNAVACSDLLISDFVERIAESPWGEQTVIVVASDHLALGNTASDILKMGDRRNMLMVIEPGNELSRSVETRGSTYDTGSTIVNFLGYKGDIGLGRDLLNESDEMQAERQYIQENVQGWGPAINEFWEFPSLQESLSIDIEAEQVLVDERTFRIPAFLLLDDAFNVQLKFDFNSEKRLADHRSEVEAEQRFLWIDECDDLWELSMLLGNDSQFCFAAGVGQEYGSVGRLTGTHTYSVEELVDLTDPDLVADYDVLFEDELRLASYSISAESITEIIITAQWDVLKQPQANHTLFVHMLNERGEFVSQIDVPMGANGEQFTSTWRAGDTWYEAYTLYPPAELPDGDYTFRVGMYDWPSLEHLLIGEEKAQFFSPGALTITDGDVEIR